MNLPPQTSIADPAVRILRIRLSVANVYLLVARRVVIVDTGNAGKESRILAELAKINLRPSDVSLILLTHGHLDHFGSALALKKATGAPVAIHAADAWALESALCPPRGPLNATARCIRPFFSRNRAPFRPDLLLDEQFQLEEFGLPGQIIHTPGHSPGSISLLLPSGELFAGDLLMGGYLGGYLRPGHPGYPYFLEDVELQKQSIRKILTLPLSKVLVGHGGPLQPAATRDWFRKIDIS